MLAEKATLSFFDGVLKGKCTVEGLADGGSNVMSASEECEKAFREEARAGVCMKLMVRRAAAYFSCDTQ